MQFCLFALQYHKPHRIAVFKNDVKIKSVHVERFGKLDIFNGEHGRDTAKSDMLLHD